MFDSKKKVKLTSAEGVEHKLVKKQLQAIEFNKALLAMYTNQVRGRPPQGGGFQRLTADCFPPQAEQCRKLSCSLQAQNPGHPLPVLIQVAQLCREKQHSRAVELLQVDPPPPLPALRSGSLLCLLGFQQFSDKHPESASGIRLTMAQLYLAQGDS